MAMNRRRFLATAIRGAAIVALPIAWAGRRFLPGPFTEAIRTMRRYPGPVVALDEAKVRRPSRHAG